jgi:hypothetical protein
MSAQSVRRATWANSDAAIAELFVGVWDPEDYVHIATSRWLWLTSCRRSLHRNDDGVHADHIGDGTRSSLADQAGDGAGTSQPVDSCCGT